MNIIKVAVPVPLRRLFDYAVPEHIDIKQLQPGQRIWVPFGTKQLLAITTSHPITIDHNSTLLTDPEPAQSAPTEPTSAQQQFALETFEPAAMATQSKPSKPPSSTAKAATGQHYDPSKIKALIGLVDPQPVFDSHQLTLLQWAARYYQHPLGEVYNTALPILLKEGKPIADLLPDTFRLSDKGQALSPLALAKTKKQQQALEKLQGLPTGSTFDRSQLKTWQISTPIFKQLIDKKLVEHCAPQFTPFAYLEDQTRASQDQQQQLQLNLEQALAVSTTIRQLNTFYPMLLEGVTGSGKTEVYLQIIEQVLQKNQQVLVLVPEIGLTPQTLKRFNDRFDTLISVWHSSLNNRERFNTWLDAKTGRSAITIGTRSAIFLPFNQLGLIVIDEEHDASFKQQDTFRYNARDMAIFRAKMLNIPIILGTATPSLESLKNALDKKYHHFELAARISGHQHKYNVIDIKALVLKSGLSQPLVLRLDKHLKQHNQVMLFINRRGYAPSIICHECSWICECQRCSAFYTFHKADRQLICHHCGSQSRIPLQCGQCGSTNIQTAGQGTEQIEEVLAQFFPGVPISRLDRDSTRRKGSFEQAVDEINQPGRRIIVGTQMIAKGHHFPNVTLVAILDVDGALFSADFRASERLAQLLIQVSGRAGRGSEAGEIALQTHFPSHPLLQDLIYNGYGHFARLLLKERQMVLLPPYASQLLIRAHANDASLPKAFLQATRTLFEPYIDGHPLEILGPLPAPLEKKAGNYRFQLVIQSEQRGLIQGLLKNLLPSISKIKSANKVRWSLDIDPIDMN